MGNHLVLYGYTPNYTQWGYHGEQEDRGREEVVRRRTDDYDTGFQDMVDDLEEARVPTEEEPEATSKAYLDMLAEASTDLHAHTKVNKLDAIARIMAVKTQFNLSRELFDVTMAVIGSLLPEGHLLPKSMYEVNKMLSVLKLPAQCLHSCKNGCTVFDREYADAKHCPKCNFSRYVEVDHGKGLVKSKVPHKVLRMLSFSERIGRMMLSDVPGKAVTHHKLGKKYKYDKDHRLMLTHLSDGEAWKDFDRKYPEKAAEPRNVRVAIATDGFNPFGMTSAPYSCWPVFVIPLNLSPGMIMQRKYMFLALIIPGPEYPGKNIIVYMRPLMEELKRGWGEGIMVYDKATKTNFRMDIWFQFSIHDHPGGSILCGKGLQGKLMWPHCRIDLEFYRLAHGRKYCCFDLHRRFLPPNHPFREDKKNFRKGVDALVPDPTQPHKFLGYGDTHNWTHKSWFWELHYFKDIILPHCIDVMHTEKNVAEALFNTILNIIDKTKDNPKARKDQEKLCDRPCQAANLKRGVNPGTMRINGLKSHDYHIWLERLLLVMVRGNVSEDIWRVLAELSNFFCRLCAKELSPTLLEEMEKQAPVLLCKLERIFPPSMFVTMQHLIIHLPYEAQMWGPVQHRWMYAVERLMKTLRAKVKNKAKVEACIWEASRLEEVSNATTSYCSSDIATLHNPVSRYNLGNPEDESKLSLFKGQLGTSKAEKTVTMPYQEWRSLTLYILNNLDKVQPYIK
ncbi:uncharacterized protein LOC104583235 [Brachypodium distachyon]|uniref:uncharacterized protein LOC104583235 n=1 Tax=Brachypodium distachyon TaxID=15368 RepID=UPI000530095F|nr:uncharacterized protein LOC104583235 [Brachypodium distachyon]|eukprot:XP_010233350.1 uncharacterized protein LOC104583235 [Brachypodium distachyon]